MDATNYTVAMTSTQALNQDPEIPVPAAPIVGGVTTRKLAHRNMILDGTCSHCAHCGHELTDAVSIQRGIGPICSKKGYEEDAVADADEVQAMVALAEYPELVEFLVKEYKPLGIRGLVNGLVRVASLNRPRGRGQCEGNADLFDAICDAVDALGHAKLAGLLRETLVVVEVKEAKGKDGFYDVWVKKANYRYSWSIALRNLRGTEWDRTQRKVYVLIHKPGEKDLLAFTDVRGRGRVSNKQLLWEALVENYEGLIAKTPKGTFKIKQLQK
jgi:hypothetical protein